MKNEFAKIAKHQQSQLERVLAVKDALAQRNMELSRALRKKEHAQIQTLQKQIKLDEKIKLQNQKLRKANEHLYEVARTRQATLEKLHAKIEEKSSEWKYKGSVVIDVKLFNSGVLLIVPRVLTKKGAG